MKKIAIAAIAAIAICAAVSFTFLNPGVEQVVHAQGESKPPMAPEQLPAVLPEVPQPGVRAVDEPAQLSGQAAHNASLPWMNAAPATAATSPDAVKSPASSKATESRLDESLRHLQQLQASNVTDPKQVSEAILRVEQANGSPILHGVRLDVLRNNLLIAEKMATISQELQSMGSRPASAAQSAAMQPKLDQLEALRKQLRTDVVEPSVSVASGSK